MAVIPLKKPQGGALKLDKSYNLIDKDPCVDQLAEWIRQSGRTYKSIAEEAGLARATVNNLFMGKTIRPLARTENKLGRLFGKRLGWVNL